MGCQKKKLSSILLQERETPLPLLKYPFEALSAWGCLDEQVQVIYHSLHNQCVHNGSKKGKCEVSPVSWGPMDSVISVPSMLSSSSTTTLPLVRPLGWRKRHKQINKRQRKRTRQEKKSAWVCLRGGWGWWCGHKLVKYSHSCHWFLMEALKPLGKAEGW